MNIQTEELMWGDRLLKLETGRIARQATGSVVVSYGDSIVLCTVVGSATVKTDIDFFPLSVHYQEKTFAVGRIPGGFMKREGKPSDKEVLVSRLIDRSLRPLFPELLRNEIQVVCTVLSYDPESDADIAAMIGASAALSISGIPFKGPIAGARVGYKDGDFLLNPRNISESSLDLVVAGTHSGVLMVESEAKELSEEVMLSAVVFGHESIKPVIDMIERLKSKAPLPLRTWVTPQLPEEYENIEKTVRVEAEKILRRAYTLPKQERVQALSDLKKKISVDVSEKTKCEPSWVSHAFENIQAHILRHDILDHGKRIDGRSVTDIRSIQCEVSILPRTHGSALFTRGETQAIAVTTLGSPSDEQIMDGLSGEYRERFMLHYNFPPFSVGETGRMGAPGRREVGHGKLAWRALSPLIPKKDVFPYTLRIVSEITESNGSSSMATVCGASLSLMDAGVPLPRPVAGIAMGLIKEGEKFAILSDILGDEDYLGDMDFKVAGTELGITALQMDIKITEINAEIMKQALKQAYEGRHHILNEMSKSLTQSRENLSPFAPRIERLKIQKDRIRDLIGPGGKIIRELSERTKTKIDIDDQGAVTISGLVSNLVDQAIEEVMSIGNEPEIGTICSGTVVRVVDFGAFIQIPGNREGLVHISELASRRVEKTTDVVNLGDKVKVQIIDVDDRGRIRLSMKSVA